MPSLIIAADYPALCKYAADQIAALVRNKPDAVLGLATGATPLGVYEHLVHLHRRDGLDFSHVTCFNLDEYYPLSPASPHSYHHFMQVHLFRHIHCRRWHVPDGRPRSPQELAQACLDYEAQIAGAGGIDLQLLGIGRTGHIGFNEPGSPSDSHTRLVTLAQETREDAAPAFGGLEHVPVQAVTVGIGTILEARAILLLASGTGKAQIVRDAWTASPCVDLPASWVRGHPDALLCLDESAATLLKTN